MAKIVQLGQIVMGLVWRCMVFGVLKIVTVQEYKVTQIDKRVGLYTHCVVLSIDVGKHSMELIGEVHV